MRHLSHLSYIDMVARSGSIRKAAEQLNITSTALNRRILALEDELGMPIFERLPQGVRLNIAGELLIQHIRTSMADLSKVISQISDLSGVRRGHVKLAAGSEVIGTFLPKRVADYRHSFPGVSFDILRRAPEAALAALGQYDADISLIFGPIPPTEFQTLISVELDICLAMSPDHPLAKQPHVSLLDCLNYPAIMPTEGSGLFTHLQAALSRKGIALNQVISSESHEFLAHYSQYEQAISFLLPFTQQSDNPVDDARIGPFVTRPFSARDQLVGRLHLVQMKGRVLPVAAAKFAEALIEHLSQSFPDTAH